ncbi:MAG TPA: hypothetical protein DDW65_04160 [Firmicutes bacterium]|jgi:RND family efflux transporter MFP subunit|nr:hypothetical protein [Bacillota bacterium]
MKKKLWIGIVLIFVLIILVLLKNKSDIAAKAKLTPITSYPVTVVTATRQNIAQSISQVGVINANNDVQVVSQLQGKVTAVLAAQGSYVTAGAAIVKIESDVPNSTFNARKTSYETAKKEWERQVFLHQQGLVADSDLEASRNAMETARANYISSQHDYDNSVIVSPITGIVTSRLVNLGTMLNPGTIVADVVDISQFKVDLNVAEEYAFQLKKGDPVSITCDVYPGVKFNGHISSISVKGDEVHTYPVEIVIPSTSHDQYPLKSGMYCTVTFTLPQINALIIPRTALVGSLKLPQVYVAEQGQARLRDLVLGPEIGTNLIVQQGLAQGDQVVSNGQDNLKDGIGVRIITDDGGHSQSIEQGRDNSSKPQPKHGQPLKAIFKFFGNKGEQE